MRKLGILFLSFLLTVPFISCDAQNANGEGVKNVGAEEFKQLVQEGNGILVDVRTDQEVAQGVIEGAQQINISSSDFLEKAKQLDKSKPIYLYCRSGNRSGKAANMLLNEGYTNVYNLSGGIMGWQSKGFEITKMK
jgi:rhodanese-related sulfurtransferase